MITIIKEGFLKTIVPNKSLKYYQKLDSNEKLEYLQMYSMYNHLLMQYIVKKWDLKKYDDIMSESKHIFCKVTEENKDIYQYRASNFLNYLYLRNNIYIERLSKLEQEFLLNRLKDKNFDLDEKCEIFINNTLSRVILEDKDENKFTFYGVNNRKYMKPSNSIIIGVRYDDYNLSGQTEETWMILHDRRETELFFLTNDMEKELNEKISLPVNIVRYNNFSIKKS